MHARRVHAVYGDASRTPILEHTNIYKSKLCVIRINDPYISPRILGLVKYLNPTIGVMFEQGTTQKMVFLS